MEIDEIKEIMREVFGCLLEESKEIEMFWKVPNPQVYNAESVGFELHMHIKTSLKESSRDCLRSVVKKRKLKMNESEKVLVIYTPRKK